MPGLIRGQLIWNRRARTYQRHLATKNVEKLRQLIETRLPQELADGRNPLVARQLEDFAGDSGSRRNFLVDQLRDELTVNGVIVVDIHRTELQEYELLPMLSYSHLAKQNRALRRSLYGNRDKKTERKA